MKRAFSLCAAALMLTLALPVSALAAETAAVCYPTSVTRSEDGTELKKIYDLAPEEDPAGIPRSDFEQDGFRYTLTDLLKQELPEHEERQHTETVSLPSKNKDMASVRIFYYTIFSAGMSMRRALLTGCAWRSNILINNIYYR